jgi:hypothetical protein
LGGEHIRKAPEASRDEGFTIGQRRDKAWYPPKNLGAEGETAIFSIRKIKI